jgi:hypothetical protein
MTKKWPACARSGTKSAPGLKRGAKKFVRSCNRDRRSRPLSRVEERLLARFFEQPRGVPIIGREIARGEELRRIARAILERRKVLPEGRIENWRTRRRFFQRPLRLNLSLQMLREQIGDGWPRPQFKRPRHDDRRQRHFLRARREKT